MKSMRKQTTAATHHAPSSAIVSTIVDTSWRMFVPTIGLLLLGRYVDDSMGFRPIGVVVGTGIGTMLSTYLIIRLLSAVREE